MEWMLFNVKFMLKVHLPLTCCGLEVYCNNSHENWETEGEDSSADTATAMSVAVKQFINNTKQSAGKKTEAS